MIYDDQPQMTTRAAIQCGMQDLHAKNVIIEAFAAIDPDKLVEKVLSGVDLGWDVRRGQIEAVLVVAGILPDVEGIK